MRDYPLEKLAVRQTILEQAVVCLIELKLGGGLNAQQKVEYRQMLHECLQELSEEEYDGAPQDI